MMELLNNARKIVYLEEVESTNLYLRQLVREEQTEEGSVVIADYQTGGRGQMGNSWHAARGENLLLSLLLYPKGMKANEQFIISRIASLAVKNMLDQFTDDIRIKWPNDIYWKDKKIAGMLIESDIQGKEILHSIIGIGVNLNQQLFPPALPNPVSLRQITGIAHDRDQIVESFMREFFLLYREFQHDGATAIEDEYMLDLYHVNDYYWFEDSSGRFMAMIEDVLPSGHLVLRTLESDEERRYAFKEVAFVD